MPYSYLSIEKNQSLGKLNPSQEKTASFSFIASAREISQYTSPRTKITPASTINPTTTYSFYSL